MAQPVEVMAFRKRLRKRGYTAISILRDTNQGVYRVSACEPLAGQRVETKMSYQDMYEAMR